MKPAFIPHSHSFLTTQAGRLNVQMPCVTFDHPLYIKAVDSLVAAGLNIVCPLGVFLTNEFFGLFGTSDERCRS